MKLHRLIILCSLFLCTAHLVGQPIVETVEKVVNQNVEISTEKDFHVTASSSAIENGTIKLKSADSWLFFDNIRPSRVLSDYGSSIFIYDEQLKANENARVCVYKHGTVIIPQDTLFEPLTVYTDINYGGDAVKYNTYYQYKSGGTMAGLTIPIGDMDNRARSFKLKRGYMATFANSPYGTEYSRVFIADKEDINIPLLQPELDRSISYIRVMPWDWPSKKGWDQTDLGYVNMVDATWFYSWSASYATTVNYQYVPIKQKYDWPEFDQINYKENVSHLLGYNEPDREDQADMTVDQAIAQWPQLISTGLRLGSPVPSNPGNGNGWLYNFLKKCDELNYRVDYVVVHAYWGGKSAKNWYNDLKSEYEKCGRRPLWITEWNNGANWTGESWPADPEEQKAKQLKDLKEILNVLDTCSFVERYSIYDWVNEGWVNGKKDVVIRAMIWDGQLTPAGEYYKDNKPGFAYNQANEVVPTWKPLAPSMSKVTMSKDKKGLSLVWNDPNGTLTTQYILKRQVNGGAYEEILRTSDCYETSFVDTDVFSESGYVNYQVESTVNGQLFVSNVVNYYVGYGSDDKQYGMLEQEGTDWMICKYKASYSGQNPIVAVGVPSFNNGATKPFTYSVGQLDTASFAFKIYPWTYLSAPSIAKEDIPYLVLPEGKSQLGDIQVQAQTLSNINRIWKTITFPEEFETIPVVLATQISNRTQIPTTVRVRNVTKTGFDIAIQKEEGESKTIAREDVCYVAMTPGVGNYGGRTIAVGLTEPDFVGGLFESGKITFPLTFVKPTLFAATQSSQDEITTTLRQNRLRSGEAVVFRSRETSLSSSQSNIAKEMLGWVVLETDAMSSIDEGSGDSGLWNIYPTVVSDEIHISSVRQDIEKIEIYNTVGKLVENNFSGETINVRHLNAGVYFLKVNDSQVFRFLKK